MNIARAKRPLARVTLVPLIDVLFILLVYFMVTSVYLDLDMIPAAATNQGLPPLAQGAGQGGSLLLQIRADGQIALRGRALPPQALAQALASEGDPGRLTVMILPSGQAPVQALASTLDALAAAGIAAPRIVRLEAQP